MEWYWKKQIRGLRLSHYLARRFLLGKHLGWRYLLLPIAFSYLISFKIALGKQTPGVK